MVGLLTPSALTWRNIRAFDEFDRSIANSSAQLFNAVGTGCALRMHSIGQQRYVRLPRHIEPK